MASDTERLETNGAETNVHETINDGKLDEATTQASPPDQKKKTDGFGDPFSEPECHEICITDAGIVY